MLPDAFGCAVANRFGDLLDDEADPLDLISRVETLKDKKKRKEEEERKNRQKKAGQKESQRDRRARELVVPGECSRRACWGMTAAPRLSSF